MCSVLFFVFSLFITVYHCLSLFVFRCLSLFITVYRFVFRCSLFTNDGARSPVLDGHLAGLSVNKDGGWHTVRAAMVVVGTRTGGHPRFT